LRRRAQRLALEKSQNLETNDLVEMPESGSKRTLNETNQTELEPVTKKNKK
jgi:hypothetical protein